MIVTSQIIKHEHIHLHLLTILPQQILNKESTE